MRHACGYTASVAPCLQMGLNEAYGNGSKKMVSIRLRVSDTSRLLYELHTDWGWGIRGA